MSKGVFVRKAGGELEEFQPAKLRASLKKSGAGERSVERVMDIVLNSIHEGMRTKDIYKLAYKALRRESKPVAVRYKLKQAIMELGPSGYPFERLAGEVFKAMGYRVRIGVVVRGFCVSHEVDVFGEKDHIHAMAECKFHNRAGEKSDVKTAMYVAARFEDISKQYARQAQLRSVPVEPWLVTNTKFSTDAVAYGTCVGLRLLAWNYPQTESLQSRIEQHCLYPVTSLMSLSAAQKRHLLQEGMVLYTDVLAFPTILRDCGVGEHKAQEVLREIDTMLCAGRANGEKKGATP